MENYTPIQQQKRGVNWGHLVVGILFVLAGILAFINPLGNLEALAMGFAFLAIIGGIWRIASPFGGVLRIVAGIFDILIGIFLLTNIYVAAMALPTVFAIWFIVDSLLHLVMLGYTRTLLGNGYFWLSLVINILGIIVGIMLLFSSVTAALTLTFLVGFYLLIAGIDLLIFAFMPKINRY